jgi:hypothetical protein
LGRVIREGSGPEDIDGHHLARAFDVLQRRPGMSQDEMAGLEFLCIRILSRTAYGIPNLERQLSENPSLFVYAIALAHERHDGVPDPADWRIDDPQQKMQLTRDAHILLESAKRIPGTTDTGSID